MHQGEITALQYAVTGWRHSRACCSGDKDAAKIFLCAAELGTKRVYTYVPVRVWDRERLKRCARGVQEDGRFTAEIKMESILAPEAL